MNREMNAEIRLREFAPVVIEELTANGEGFTFEEYVIHLASYMENGSREIINQLHTANRLIPELLNGYAVEDPEQGKFFARTTVITERDVNGREHLCAMDPADFERLIAEVAETFLREAGMFYYRGLHEWEHERGYLTDTCLTAQDRFKAIFWTTSEFLMKNTALCRKRGKLPTAKISVFLKFLHSSAETFASRCFHCFAALQFLTRYGFGYA